MANVTITQLPSAGPIQGDELVPIVQNGQTLRTTTAALAGSPVQTQTFITLNQEPTLNNSRALAGGTGVGLVDNGAQSTLQITLNGASGSLEAASNGLIVKTGASTVTNRSVAVSGDGLSIVNGDGISGNPTLSLSGLPLALTTLGGTGLLAVVGGTTIAGRQIFGTTNQITVANGNGGGDPTIAMADNPIFPGTAAVTLPVGTTAQQPVGANGQLRFNSDTQTFDGYASGSWRSFSLAGGVTTFSAGSTGLTPSSATSGVVTLGGILNVSSGGTGASTLTGYLVGNGTSAITAVATIPNAGLTNSSVTYNGITVALGASGTITAANPQALTIGTGLLGSSYDGSSAVTISIDSTVATLTGSQTLTNKSMSGSSNTFTDIPNGALTNSAITIGSTSVSLGGTITTLAGTSISGSTNTLSNIGNSSLVNSSVTYNGVTVALGASATITASTTSALTVGTGLQLNSGTTFDGSSAKTISIDSTVVTLSNTQTLTNKTLTTPVIAQISNSGVLTLPSSTDTLVGRATTDTLTNKSISGSTNTLTDIPNSALTNSSVTIGTTGIALGASSLTLAGLTSIAVTQNPTTALQVATKQYVDGLVSSGITFHTPVKYEVPSTTGNLNATYNQPGGPGVGVGATLTNAGTLAAFAPDGPTASPGDRILIYNQTNAFENGVYTVTVVGDGSTAWVLTRATDADTYALKSINGLGEGDAFFIQAGNTGAGETYVCNTQGTITFGTTAITFVQVSSSQVYSAGTGLTLSGTQFSITNTSVSAATYGSASVVPVFSVNAQGQITSVVNTSIALAASQITSGTLAVAQGGTNIASYTIGDLLYASGSATLSKLGIGSNTHILTSNGSVPLWTNPSSVTVGTATNATNTAITANSTNATNYLTFVSATTGNLPQLVNSNLTVNPSTGQITGGVAGGSF